MIVIQNTNSLRFSLDGIPYLKNYISAVHGDRVEIFNCYERCDVLVQNSHYSQFSVNGTIYSSAAALQNALLPVLYSRNTIGNSLLEQDNIDIRKYFTYSDTDTTAQVIQKINNLATYTIDERQSVWFIGRTRILFNSLSSPLTLPDGDIILDPFPIFTTNSIVKYKMVNKGKGTYGLGGIQLTSGDIELVYQNKVNEDDVAEDPQTQTINFGSIMVSLPTWINQCNPAITLQPQNDGYTIFKGTISGASKSYLFTGIAGTYGVEQLQAQEADFQLLGGVTPAVFIPTLSEVLSSGNAVKDKTMVLAKDIELFTLSSAGFDYKYTDKQKAIRFAEPARTDNALVSYTIPAKKKDDVFVMESDTKVQATKIIDSFVAGTLYTVVTEDFGKTLIYNGDTNINMLLSTLVEYTQGGFINILQRGSGKITFVTDEFILNHSADEDPVTFGQHSMAGLLITDSSTPEVLVYGKLKLA